VTDPILHASGITKRYGHVHALRGVDFHVDAGEIVALVGDNGAGKSSLIKVLSGALSPDTGEIEVLGVPTTFRNPSHARAVGIETVYQDLALAIDLPPDANVFLGREYRRTGLAGKLGFLDKPRMRKEVTAAFRDLSIGVPVTESPTAGLSGGQQQGVSICRAVFWASKVVFFDEPTAALGVVQSGRVLDVLKIIRDRGTGVVLISHNMQEVRATADRIVVLRLGKNVAEMRGAEATNEALLGAMTGSLDQAPPFEGSRNV
jgi:simple sugar transport system ATP-binding protein